MWLKKIAFSDIERISRNMERLESLRLFVHELSHFALASQSGTYQIIEKLLSNKLILGRPKLHGKLLEAFIGENNQKIALDAPKKCQLILGELESLIIGEINKNKRELRSLRSEAKEESEL